MDSSVPILPARRMLLSGARASNGQEPLCSIVSDSYERKNLILTTNLEFSKWGSVFTDEQMAAAVLDPPRQSPDGRRPELPDGARPHTAGCSSGACFLTRPAESGEFPTMTMGNSDDENGKSCLTENTYYLLT